MRALHEDSTAAVRAYGKLSDKFSVISGLQQGCVLVAPILFNLNFDVAIRMALVETKRALNLEMLVTDLEYTDDMVLLASNWSDLTTMLNSPSAYCKTLDLTISCKKTISLAVLPLDDPATKCPVPIHLFQESEPIKVISHFQYLGSNVQNDCGTGTDQLQELQGFICLPVTVAHLVASTQDPPSTKVRVFNSVILPEATHHHKQDG